MLQCRPPDSHFCLSLRRIPSFYPSRNGQTARAHDACAPAFPRLHSLSPFPQPFPFTLSRRALTSWPRCDSEPRHSRLIRPGTGFPRERKRRKGHRASKRASRQNGTRMERERGGVKGVRWSAAAVKNDTNERGRRQACALALPTAGLKRAAVTTGAQHEVHSSPYRSVHV